MNTSGLSLHSANRKQTLEIGLGRYMAYGSIVALILPPLCFLY